MSLFYCLCSGHQLIQILNNHGINANSTNVIKFPGGELYCFSFKASLPDMEQALPQILDCIRELEGESSFDFFNNEIHDMYQSQFSPGQLSARN